MALSDAYFDTSQYLHEKGERYFGKGSEVYGYSEHHRLRLHAFISLLEIESRLLDLMGDGLVGDPHSIAETIINSNDKKPIEDFNEILESLKIRVS